MEKKDQKIALVITSKEIEDIDDWRFSNRIGSQSEAVRRLIRKGLAAEEAGQVGLLQSNSAKL